MGIWRVLIKILVKIISAKLWISNHPPIFLAWLTWLKCLQVTHEVLALLCVCVSVPPLGLDDFLITYLGVLNWEQFVPQGMLGTIWRHLWLSQLGGSQWVEASMLFEPPATYRTASHHEERSSSKGPWCWGSERIVFSPYSCRLGSPCSAI